VEPAPHDRLTRRLAEAGFDVVAAGPVGGYNHAVEAEWRLAAPHGDATTVILVGGGRAVWAAFRRAIASDPGLLTVEHPLDTWAEGLIRSIVASLVPIVELRETRMPPPRGVAAQRLAVQLGLAAAAPCHLVAHPIFGPWFGLRATVVVDRPWTGPSPEPQVRPCAGCPAPCADASAKVGALPPDAVTWRSWLAVRDACPVGREHRYGEDQLQYHSTKDRSILTRSAGSE
jgi:methylmalonic aciduria homocystinuria type C protein